MDIKIAGLALGALVLLAGCGTSTPSEGDAFTCPLTTQQASTALQTPQSDLGSNAWYPSSTGLVAGCTFVPSGSTVAEALFITETNGSPQELQSVRDSSANEWEHPLVSKSAPAGGEALNASDGGVWQITMMKGLPSSQETSDAVTSIADIIRSQ